MKRLFEPSYINSLLLKNRFIRSATWTGMAANNGDCTPQLVGLMTRLSKGGVGLIITGHAYVREDGKAGPQQLGIYRDEQIEGFKKMAEGVHENGGKIIVQLSHGGLYAISEFTGQKPLVPSFIAGLSEKQVKIMSIVDINNISEAFAKAATRAVEANLDGIQILAGHGYLLNQFLSPFYNKRNDEYGGNLQNRSRFLLEVIRAIRKVVAPSYPVIIKSNCSDYLENGITLEDSIEIDLLSAKEGVDAIEISGGTLISRKHGPIRRGISTKQKEAYFYNQAKATREKITIPLILVGGIRSYNKAQQLISEGVVDYLALSRPLICEPDLINRWETGNHKKSKCISDNQCFRAALMGKGLYCVHEANKNV